MTWPREESRPRINQDSRRVGLLTLVLGGLVIAGLLVMLVPAEQQYSAGRLDCGTPLSSAFKSVRDYEAQYFQEQVSTPVGSRAGDASVEPPPRSLLTAGAACVSGGRTRTSIGGGLLLLALVGGAGVLVATRRSRAQRDG
jgi:hypothetical protein